MPRAASLPGADLFSLKTCFFQHSTCPGQLRCPGQNFFRTNNLSQAASLPGAELFLKERTFRNSGAPVRRTGRRRSQKMDLQEFWHSCAQNKTSEIPKTALSQILGLLCAEQDVGNVNKWTFRNSGTPGRRTRRGESPKNALSGIPGLLCAEQDVGNLKKMSFQEVWDSCAQDKMSEISKMYFQEFWDSCAQNKTSEI